jgi:hypothetical protein
LEGDGRAFEAVAAERAGEAATGAQEASVAHAAAEQAA